MRTAVIFLALAATAASATTASDVKRYLVGINHSTDPDVVLRSSLLRGRRLDASKIENVHRWPHPNHVDARNHLARLLLSDEEADELSAHSEVSFIEQDNYVWIPEANNDGTDPLGISVPYPDDNEAERLQTDMSGGLTQSAESSWALDRLDQRNLPLDGKYSSAPYEGESVRIYIIDTGVRCDHDEITGRCEAGMNFAPSDEQYLELGGDGLTANVDCHGHGTHVASTAAGIQWGVAKKATIVPVRSMDCSGGGTVSNIIDGILWSIADAAEHPDKRSVISMSLLSGASEAINDAIKQANIDDIVASVAAGNYARNACLFSPAQETSALTVGATDDADKRSGFSNWGACVDVFAPGSSIRGADSKTAYSSRLLSGTSMATPLVSGIVALVLDKNPKLSATQAIEYVVNNAEKFLVYNECEGSKNAIAQVPKESDPMDPSELVPPKTVLLSEPWSYLSEVPSVFLHWKDEFSISTETYQKKGLCFVFQAKSISGTPETGGIRLAISSGLPFEKRVEMSTNEGTCDSPATTWYFIYADHGQYANIYEFDVKEATSENRVPHMHSDSETYWIRAQEDDRGVLNIDFGNGSEPGNGTIVAYSDRRPPTAILRLAFSSPEGHSMGYGAIRHCTSEVDVPDNNDIHFGHPITTAPTSRPTLLYSDYLAPKNTEKFVEFRGDWTADSTDRACWEFDAVGTQELQVTLSALEESSDLLGTHASYVFAIGMEKGREVWMYRNRVLVTKQPMKPWLLHETFARTLKIVLFGDGVVQVYIEDHLIFDHFDTSRVDAVKYLSLSAGAIMDIPYTLIHDCSIAEEESGGFGEHVPGNFELPPIEARDCVKIPTRGRCWQTSELCRWNRESDQCGVA